jgi:hypothetical protein
VLTVVIVIVVEDSMNNNYNIINRILTVVNQTIALFTKTITTNPSH